MLSWVGMCCWSSQRLFRTCFQPARSSQLLEHISKLEPLALTWKKSQASRNCGQWALLPGFLSSAFTYLLLLFSLQPILEVEEFKDHETSRSCLALVLPAQGASWTGLASAPQPAWSRSRGPGGSEKHLGWMWLCFWMPLWNPVYLSLNITLFVASFSFCCFTQGRLQGFYISRLTSVGCQHDVNRTQKSIPVTKSWPGWTSLPGLRSKAVFAKTC